MSDIDDCIAVKEGSGVPLLQSCTSTNVDGSFPSTITNVENYDSIDYGDCIKFYTPEDFSLRYSCDVCTEGKPLFEKDGALMYMEGSELVVRLDGMELMRVRVLTCPLCGMIK